MRRSVINYQMVPKWRSEYEKIKKDYPHKESISRTQIANLCDATIRRLGHFAATVRVDVRVGYEIDVDEDPFVAYLVIKEGTCPHAVRTKLDTLFTSGIISHNLIKIDNMPFFHAMLGGEMFYNPEQVEGDESLVTDISDKTMWALDAFSALVGNLNSTISARMSMVKLERLLAKESTMPRYYYGGGKAVDKVHILGRERNVYLNDRVKYVTYNKELIRLSEAKKLDKAKAKAMDTKKKKGKN